MDKLKKFFKTTWGIITALAIFLLTGWALFRQIIKNKASKGEIENLRKGLNDVAKKNDKIINDAVKNIKKNEEILAKTEEKLAKMDLKEKVELAKKLGY